MQVAIAVYTFIASIFAIFVLWGTKNLGLFGLLSSFAVGLISYGLTSSLEISVATIILVGILINFLYPYIQRRWVESYANYNAGDVTRQIETMRSAFNSGNAPGLPPKMLEGFQDAPTTAPGRAGVAAASLPVAGGGMAGAGAGVAGAGAGMAGAGGAGMAGAGAGMAAASLPMAATQGSTPVPLPNVNGSGATTIMTPPRAPPTDMSTVQASQAPSMAGSEPAPLQTGAQTQNTVNPSGSPAAPATDMPPVGTTMQQATQQPPASTDNTGAQPEISAFKNPSTSGLFKLGELPSSTANGPHIDAGTTIMRALGALNSDQISSLTSDTRQLLDTQKSLMNMLTTMKPMLSDGQNLLASFTNMFGKQ